MVVTTELIDAAKMARRMNTNAFDAQVSRLLTAALRDLYVAGVDLPATAEPLAVEAAITYFLVHFGTPDEYDRLKASYDEQKAQLATLTGFTDWGLDTDTADAPTTFDIVSDGETVTTSGADILAAYLRGADLRLVVENAVMFATGYDYTGGVLTANFQSGTELYKVTTAGEAVALVNNTIRTNADDVVYYDIHVMNATTHRDIAENPLDIISAYEAGNVLRLVENGVVMNATSCKMENGELTASFYTSSRLYSLRATKAATYAEIELFTAKPETTDRTVWEVHTDFPIISNG